MLSSVASVVSYPLAECVGGFWRGMSMKTQNGMPVITHAAPNGRPVS